ncbi:Papain-like cysteine peptidase [Gracilaria domingensis]|nr:Papain-like cysteine peptidase [Gracilaria domingensis]
MMERTIFDHIESNIEDHFDRRRALEETGNPSVSCQWRPKKSQPRKCHAPKQMETTPILKNSSSEKSPEISPLENLSAEEEDLLKEEPENYTVEKITLSAGRIGQLRQADGWVENDFMDLFAFRLRNRNVERVRKHSVGEKVVVLDSFFVSRLRHARDNHKRNEVFDDLHRWFQKTSWTFEEAEKILCPYLSGRHWFLLAVNFQDDMVTMYVSFSRNTETASEAAELLKQFLNFVAQKRSGKEKDWVTLEKAAYPKQTDGGSCGLFVAFVMEYLERGAVPLFEQRNIPLTK